MREVGVRETGLGEGFRPVPPPAAAAPPPAATASGTLRRRSSWSRRWVLASGMPLAPAWW